MAEEDTKEEKEEVRVPQSIVIMQRLLDMHKDDIGLAIIDYFLRSPRALDFTAVNLLKAIPSLAIGTSYEEAYKEEEQALEQKRQRAKERRKQRERENKRARKQAETERLEREKRKQAEAVARKVAEIGGDISVIEAQVAQASKQRSQNEDSSAEDSSEDESFMSGGEHKDAVVTQKKKSKKKGHGTIGAAAFHYEEERLDLAVKLTTFDRQELLWMFNLEKTVNSIAAFQSFAQSVPKIMYLIIKEYAMMYIEYGYCPKKDNVLIDAIKEEIVIHNKEKKEMFVTLKEPQLLGQNNAPFEVKFDVEFRMANPKIGDLHDGKIEKNDNDNKYDIMLNDPSIASQAYAYESIPENTGYHGGIYLGMNTLIMSRSLANNYPKSFKQVTCVDWIDNDHGNGFANIGCYHCYHQLDAFKDNDKSRCDKIQTPAQGDSVARNWRFVFGKDGKVQFFGDGVHIHTFKPHAFTGYIGFWTWGRTFMRVMNLDISPIVDDEDDDEEE